MTAVARPTPHGRQLQSNGTGAVIDTGSVRADQHLRPVVNLFEPGAGNPASTLKKDTAVVSPSRLHRYAIQGLPGKH